MIFVDEKAQVSFEYLLTILFGIIFAVAAFGIAQYIHIFALEAGVDISDASEKTIEALMA